MKRILSLIIIVLCLGVIEVHAVEPLTVSTCGVSITTNYDTGDVYKAKIDRVTEGAPLPTSTEISLKSGEEKTFGVTTYTTSGLYEYKVTLDKSDVYYIYTVQIVEDNGKLFVYSFAKENGDGEKTDKVKFNIKNDVPVNPTPSRPVNPYTADAIFKFVLALAVSGLLILFVIKQLSKNKKEEKLQ